MTRNYLNVFVYLLFRALWKGMRGYRGGTVDFMTGIALIENEKRMLPYCLHFCERKVNLIWEYRISLVTKLRVEKGRNMFSFVAVFIILILKYIKVVLYVTSWPYIKLLRLLLHMLCSCQLFNFRCKAIFNTDNKLLRVFLWLAFLVRCWIFIWSCLYTVALFWKSDPAVCSSKEHLLPSHLTMWINTISRGIMVY